MACAQNVGLGATEIVKQINPYYRGCASYTQERTPMKQMTTKILINLDAETESKLNDLSKDSDKSKVIRNLILREWDTKNNSIRVPLVGTIGKAGSYNGHTVIEDI